MPSLPRPADAALGGCPGWVRGLSVLRRPRLLPRAQGLERAPGTWAQGLPGSRRPCPRSATSAARPGSFCPSSLQAALVPRAPVSASQPRPLAAPLPGAALGALAHGTAASAHPGLAHFGLSFLKSRKSISPHGRELSLAWSGGGRPAVPAPPPSPDPRGPALIPAACVHRISPNGFADDSTFSLKAAPRPSPPPLRPLLPAAGPCTARPPSAFLAGRDAAPATGVRHPARLDATRGARSPRTGWGGWVGGGAAAVWDPRGPCAPGDL